MSPIKHKNKSCIQDIEEVLQENSPTKKPSGRPALRETSSRLNRPLPASSLLRPLPELNEDETTLQLESSKRPTGLVDDGDTTQDVAFGFLTPSKRKTRQSLLQRVVTNSAQKFQQQQTQTNDEKSPSPETKKTPKTSQTASPKAGRSPRTPRTPMGTRATLATPKCVPKTYADGVSTPRSRRSLAPQLDPIAVPDTPKTFRTRMRTRIQEVTYFSDDEMEDLEDSDDDQEYHPDESACSEPNNSALSLQTEDEESPAKDCGKRRSPAVKKNRGRSRKILKADMDESGSNADYFLHNDGSAALTSDHTLNKLSVPRLSGDAFRAIIGGVGQDHAQERRDLHQEQTLMFGKWRTLLEYGFSIFLHGVGSKKKLLSEFQEEFISNEDHIVVNGFFPSLTLKSIFLTILDEILEVDSPPNSVPEQLALLCCHYSSPRAAPLYLLFHNIDGPMLRAPATQKSLAHLSALPKVRLIASVDHINAPLVLDSDLVAEYNVLWFDATTMAPYVEETSYENSLLVQQSSNLALSSLIHVFKSLTPTTRAIYLLLTDYQLEHQKEQFYSGLSFTELYQRCRERMLVNSELTLRAQLTEFLDHKLLRQKKGADGTENFLIPLDGATLKEFVEQQEVQTD